MRANVYPIEGLWSGRLAILPRPRGGDWLEDEIAAWRAAGFDVVVSALQADEAGELELDREEAYCRAHGIEYISFPILDRGVPSSTSAVGELVHRLEKCLVEGSNVAVHCRQGVGRSALLAACVLAGSGMDVQTAFDRVRAARGCNVPDTVEQREWVGGFVREHLTRAGLVR